VIGGRRFGMMIARPNWRALYGSTAAIGAPSRTWRCQSSGRPMVICWGVEVIGEFSHRA
jgi:hypothetical protein